MRTKTAFNWLPATEFGTIPSERQKAFYRVESWDGRFIADFACRSDAERFAILDARHKGARYDHQVSTCRLRGS